MTCSDEVRAGLLEVSKLGFSYERDGIFLFRNLNATFREGLIYCITGENGCGKTTLFNILSGFSAPTEGSVRCYGRQVSRLSPVALSQLAGGLTRTFQTPVLVDTLSVEENLRLAQRSKGERFSALLLPRRTTIEDRLFVQRMEALLVALELAPLRHKLAEQLSYGLRRLVATAIALLTNARILLLDEPFANVDPTHSELLRRVMLAESHQRNRCIIIVEHVAEVDNVAVADFLCPLQEGLQPIPSEQVSGGLATLRRVP